jgi:glyoxylase-like metal-dependent hydrolase (beta-lactamase superfamily II)
VREIVDGVFEIRVGFVHVHVVVMDGGLVLVDTGLPRGSGAVEKALAGAGRRIGEVSAVLLTHEHADHVGGLARLRRDTRARVVARAEDVPVIAGDRAPTLKPLQRLMAPLIGSPEPAAVDEVLSADGAFSVPGFTAIHTPGHTPGHVSYLLNRGGGVLFVGDAAAGGARVHPSPRPMTHDPALARTSLERLAGLSFDVAVFGHGRAVTSSASARFRAHVGR